MLDGLSSVLSCSALGSEFGAHDRAAQAGPIIQLRARLIFVNCCYPCHFLCLPFPTNQATKNWTVVLTNWNKLRMQWQYSHAVNDMVTFAALVCVVIAVLRQPSQ